MLLAVAFVLGAATVSPSHLDQHERALVSSLYYRIGNMMLKGGDLDEAERALTYATAFDATAALPHRSLGVLYARLGKPELAAQHYARYLELDPAAPERESISRQLELSTSQP